MCSREIDASSVVFPTPLRPTRPVRLAPNVRSILEKRERPSGVDSDRSDRMIEAGMEFPVSKAGRLCGRGQIHGSRISCLRALYLISSKGEIKAWLAGATARGNADVRRRPARSTLERSDHDLDQRAAAEIGDADGSAGRQIVAEELSPDRVHLLLLGKIRDEDRGAHDARLVGTRFLQIAGDLAEDVAGLLAH